MIRSTFAYLISPPPTFTPLRRLKSCSRLFQRLCCGFGRRRCLRRRAKSFPGEFSFWSKFFTEGFLLLLMLHPNTWKKERPTMLRLKGLWGAQSVEAYGARGRNPRANSNLRDSTFICARIVWIKHVFAGPWMQRRTWFSWRQFRLNSWFCLSETTKEVRAWILGSRINSRINYYYFF